MFTHPGKSILSLLLLFYIHGIAFSQNSFIHKNSAIYAGIEVGSKGVKLSVLEIEKSRQKTNSFNIIKDTAVNTDFISFTDKTFSETLNGFVGLFLQANKNYRINTENIFTTVSSGVKVQADKENKISDINKLIDSFKVRIHEKEREVRIIDVTEEARLSHLGIVPEERRYTTFLIDIGSGNTKGGYFPEGNTSTLKLFQLTWGTKSISNEVEKRAGTDYSVEGFRKNLARVLAGQVNREVIYAVNVSNAYEMNDYVAFSGGISWALATLLYPELHDNSVVAVTYADIVKLNDRIYSNYVSISPNALMNAFTDRSINKKAVFEEAKRVHQVFDQKSLLAGTGLLLNIMRQFEGVYEKKQFYLVKNGQVGWVSAYVDQKITK
jgi:hypothetical protein